MGRLAVRVQPRSRREEIVAERGGAVVVRVTAPPVDGRANEALRRLVARRVGVAPGRVAVLHGRAGRDKVLEVEGVEEAEIRRALGLEPR